MQTIKRRFPKLLFFFSRLTDMRKAQGKQYTLVELLMGGLSLFLFKSGSRNQHNNTRSDGHFRQHYRRLFRMRLPHQDTVFDLLCALPNDSLEQVKMDLMSELFEQKWLREYRLLDKYYLIVVDATGVMRFNKRHCEHCLTQTKKGKTTYFHYVLEAKLVTPDGHAISLASEWIENPTGDFDKQDCERKAFIRLAARLKKQFPRLPICILADGLYPYENAFRICEDKGWKFIFVLQDNSLKTVQEELNLTRIRKPAAEAYTVKEGKRIREEYRYQTDIEYHKKYTLHWIQYIETRTKIHKTKTATTQSSPLPQSPAENSRFEYVTNILPDKDNVRAIGHGGRLRWKVENEGFNTQKCGDYEMEHKFAEKSYNALKNCYTLLQIAHAMNQLTEKEQCITEILKQRPKETIHNLWYKLKSYMIFCKPVIEDDWPENEKDIRPAPT